MLPNNLSRSPGFDASLAVNLAVFRLSVPSRLAVTPYDTSDTPPTLWRSRLFMLLRRAFKPESWAKMPAATFLSGSPELAKPSSTLFSLL
ncbi:hypothetical protein D3C81_1771400 [compost metagenome]